ncbi:MAG TPA: glycosyltransferase family 4 protein [Terriglobales bacterium]|nr:glycosyltransferase family 4 protein [Terriglobales bacterium]
MHIAFLNPSGQLGGAELCLLDMLAFLHQSRPEWRLTVILGEPGPLSSRAAALADVQVLRFPQRVASLGDSGATGRSALFASTLRAAPAAIAYRRKLRATLHGSNPDIIHTNGLKMHLLGAWAKPRNAKLIWHVHDYASSRPIMARLLSRFQSQADLVIANSESVAQDIRKLLPGKKVVPILNVVDLNEFSPQGPILPTPGIAPGTVKVGLVATMAWWKGHRLFLDALAKLDRRLNVHGFVIGGALYQTASQQQSVNSLKEYANRLGIADRVTFTGFVDNPAAAMRMLDVVVHASTEPEPFGRVIVESMGCGKPVISSGKGGAAEVLRMGEFALTFESGNSASMAGAISRLVQDVNLRSRLGSNGLNAARLRFGRERLATELIPLYEECLMNRERNKARGAHA